MSSGIVRAAFRSAYAAQFPLVPYVDTLAIVPDQESLPDLWVTMRFEMDSEDRASVGMPAQWREIGRCVIAVFGLSGSGDAAVIAHADAVRSYFRNWEPAGGGIIVQRVPMVLQDEVSDGRWFVVIVEAQYQRTFYE